MEDEKPLIFAEIERDAKNYFDTTMSPEEWVARHSRAGSCPSFDQFSYRDKKLESWIYETHKLLRDRRLNREELRARFMTPEEIAEARRMEKEGF